MEKRIEKFIKVIRIIFITIVNWKKFVNKF